MKLLETPMVRGNFAIISSADTSPGFGEYRRIGLVELDKSVDTIPVMISQRARGSSRVIETWERLHVGKTNRCAYQRALVDALDRLDEICDKQPGWTSPALKRKKDGS